MRIFTTYTWKFLPLFYWERCRFTLLYSSFIVACCFSCNKDMENMHGQKPSFFQATLPTEVTTIIRGAGGVDTIRPQVTFPNSNSLKYDAAAYTYLWTSLRNGDTLSTRPFLTYKDFEKQDLTTISCLLKMEEKSTGITQHVTGTVFITTATREGWVLLGEKNGASMISMLGFSPQGYRKYIDMDAELGKGVALQGKPISINTLGTELPYLLGVYQYIGVVTDQEIKFIRSMDFQVNEDVSNKLTQILQPSAASPVCFDVNGSIAFTANKDDDVFAFDLNSMSQYGIMNYSLLNEYTNDDDTKSKFKTSPAHAIYGGMLVSAADRRIMFDEDKGVFVEAVASAFTSYSFTSEIPVPLPYSLNGFKMLAIHTDMKANSMDFTSFTGEPDEYTTFLHNSTTKDSYIIRFTTNGILRWSKKVSFEHVKDILTSKHKEFDINAGYLIYTKGNEVLAYDYLIGQTFTLLKFEQEVISLMKIENHIPVNKVTGREAIYEQIARKLVVCTYNPVSPNASGVFRLYRIPLGHQLPVLETEETGFPKIVDASFVPIP